MKIRFHGAAGEVTGSCHEVEAAGRRLLLDCGLIQGSREDEARNRDPFDFDPARIDGVVMSHAHLDHCGRLPLLVQRGFDGPIWAQRATADLLRVMLEDAARIAEGDAERARRRRAEGRSFDADELEPLYTQADVQAVLRLVRGLEYEEPLVLFPGLTLTLRDAGHILGSASVELVDSSGPEPRTLVYSGDLGPKGTPILRDAVVPPKADLVLLESTYGDRAHRERAATIEELGRIFHEAWEQGGNVLIPAFAVGRSQELLYWFARHYEDWGLGRWRIFLDSPMATRVIEVYDRHTRLFDEDARRVWAGKPHPFRMKNLHISLDQVQSMAINQIRGGAIVIAGSGMCTGGRIRHHLRHQLPYERNHVLFVGYQARGTLGRRLVDGAAHVRVLGHEVPVRAKRHTVGGLSAHADQPGLLDWYARIGGRPRVVLVHGEDKPRQVLARELESRFAATVALAEPGREFGL
jgi:metallo-beta-lactamase family protein